MHYQSPSKREKNSRLNMKLESKSGAAKGERKKAHRAIRDFFQPLSRKSKYFDFVVKKNFSDGMILEL